MHLHLHLGPRLRSAAVALAAACALTALGAPAAPAAPVPAAAGGSCKGTARLDGAGRPTATSTCSGRFPAGASHRAVITCDIVQGAREHLVRRTFHGEWAPTGRRATVRCGFKAYLVGASSEVRRG